MAASGCGGKRSLPECRKEWNALRPGFSLHPISCSLSLIYLYSVFRSVRMSRTETTNTTALSVLADYELHHSGSSQNTTSPSPSPSPSPPQQQQPANWPTNHRRVPPYRPVDRSLSFEERAAGSNVPEFIFIQSMLHGCWLNAVCSCYTLKI